MNNISKMIRPLPTKIVVSSVSSKTYVNGGTTTKLTKKMMFCSGLLEKVLFLFSLLILFVTVTGQPVTAPKPSAPTRPSAPTPTAPKPSAPKPSAPAPISNNNNNNNYQCFTTTDELRGAILEWNRRRDPTLTNISDWNITRTYGYPIGKWCVRKISNFTGIFANLPNFTGRGIHDISNWETSEVRTMKDTFRNCFYFNGSLNGWDTRKVTDMSGMFSNTWIFNNSLGNLNTSKVQDMSYMFYKARQFTSPLKRFTTENAKNMSNMFNGAYDFTAKLVHWDTSKVVDMSYMFANTMTFNAKLFSNTRSVVTMAYMFANTTKFNDRGSTLSQWDTSNVISMKGMFMNATAFNNTDSSKIETWDISSVQDFSNMFYRAIKFNSNLCIWNTKLQLDTTNNNGTTTINTNAPRTTNMFRLSGCPLTMTDPILVEDDATNTSRTKIILSPLCYQCTNSTNTIPPINDGSDVPSLSPEVSNVPSLSPNSATESDQPTLTMVPTLTGSDESTDGATKTIIPTITIAPTKSIVPTITRYPTMPPTITRTPTITPHPTKRVVTPLPTNVSTGTRSQSKQSAFIHQLVVSVVLIFFTTATAILSLV